MGNPNGKDSTLEVSSETIEEVRVVTLKGELDPKAPDELFRFLESQLQNGYRKIIVECSGLGHITSQSLGTLVGICVRLRKRHGDIRLASLPNRIAKIFQLTGLSVLFDLYPNVDKAVESFRRELWM